MGVCSVLCVCVCVGGGVCGERGRSEESGSSGVARPPGEPKWGQK